MIHSAGRGESVANAAVKLLTPDTLEADLSEAGPARYLAVETNGKSGFPIQIIRTVPPAGIRGIKQALGDTYRGFGGRDPKSPVIDLSLGAIFGSLLPKLGLAEEDNRETPCLTSDHVTPAAKTLPGAASPTLENPDDRATRTLRRGHDARARPGDRLGAIRSGHVHAGHVHAGRGNAGHGNAERCGAGAAAGLHGPAIRRRLRSRTAAGFDARHRSGGRELDVDDGVARTRAAEASRSSDPVARALRRRRHDRAAGDLQPIHARHERREFAIVCGACRVRSAARFV